MPHKPRKCPPTSAQLRDRQKAKELGRIADALERTCQDAKLEMIADLLERLVIAADSIATSLSLQYLKVRSK